VAKTFNRIGHRFLCRCEHSEAIRSARGIKQRRIARRGIVSRAPASLATVEWKETVRIAHRASRYRRWTTGG